MSEKCEPLSAALGALDLAFTRHTDARSGRSLVAAWASAAECGWWVCSIDEQLGGVGDSATARNYRAERDADQDGQYILGLRWIRDRHSHQLPITAELDQTPFLGGRDGRGLYISPGFVWRPVQDVSDPKGRHADRRDVYARLIAGKKSSGAIYVARRWLRTAADGHGRA